jgi:hypothetical protein
MLGESCPCVRKLQSSAKPCHCDFPSHTREHLPCRLLLAVLEQRNPKISSPLVRAAQLALFEVPAAPHVNSSSRAPFRGTRTASPDAHASMDAHRERSKSAGS